ncbi:MAG: hypoxanthine phosphoribosyltransferase [Acidobacteria bacterium]|nr:hypoxanthine phosphoribosyltransferase [Acidobacteriota bacterium]
MIPPALLDRVLFTEEQVNTRVAEVAAEISARYRGKDLKLIGVLKGSIYFLTHLSRHLTIPVKIDILAISSFSARWQSPGLVRIEKDLDEPIEGQDVLIIEDIVDTGLTLRYLLQTLAGRGPNSIAICTLLDRTSKRLVQLPVEYRCFEIDDSFVVGCGLDHRQLYRNLPYIAALRRPE